MFLKKTILLKLTNLNVSLKWSAEESTLTKSTTKLSIMS